MESRKSLYGLLNAVMCYLSVNSRVSGNVCVATEVPKKPAWKMHENQGFPGQRILEN